MEKIPVWGTDMEERKAPNRKLFIIGGAILLFLVAIFLVIFLVRPKSLKAVEVRLQRLVGIVNMYDSNGKAISLIEKMRLNSGN